jgi:pSer/pThr/pTyr-binding forkhead associated (FHA) protein
VIVGRSPGCDLIVTDRQASGRHCRIDHRTGGVVITDIGSTNGTKVNGTKITTATLQPGDRVTIGETTYTVQMS